MEKIKWSAKVTNEQVLDSIGEKRTSEYHSNETLQRHPLPQVWTSILLNVMFLHRWEDFS